MKEMKFRFLFLILLLLSICYGFMSCHAENEFIEIGAILPLTGGSAVWGNNTKMGIDLAVDKINGAGGINGKKLKILYEDTQGIAAKGVAAMQKLISVHNIEVIIDDSNSSVTLAMAPIAEREKVVLFVTGASSPKIADAGEYIYRIWNSDALQAAAICDYSVKELHLKKIAIVYITNDYGVGLRQEFEKKFEESGNKVQITEGFEPGKKDFKTIITKIKTLNADGLFFVAYPDEAPSLMKQIKELDYNGIVLGNGDVMEDEATIKAAGDAAEGIYYATNAPPDLSEDIVKNFKNDFFKKYGKYPGITADVGYDAPFILTKAISISEKFSGAHIKNNLDRIKNYKGASGLISFDEKGEVHKPMAIKKIENGKSKFISLSKFE